MLAPAGHSARVSPVGMRGGKVWFLLADTSLQEGELSLGVAMERDIMPVLAEKKIGTTVACNSNILHVNANLKLMSFFLQPFA